jgi:hypothetical protein
MSSTDLTTTASADYLALSTPAADLHEIIADNIGPDFTEQDLLQVKLPSGGATRWEIPTLDGTESAETLSGIIIFSKQTRAYWPESEQLGSPPACRSNDAYVGIGDIGAGPGERPCEPCPKAQFGSDGRRGQACTHRLVWFLLRPGDMLPVVLALPPTSHKAAKAYGRALANASLRKTDVITDIALEKDKNPDGQAYSKALPRLGARLDEDARAKARAYAETTGLRAAFERANPQADETDARAAAVSAANADGEIV